MTRLAVWLPLVAGHVLVLMVCAALLQWYEPLRVSGGSMRPTLHSGDIVVVARGGRVRTWDVVLVRGPGKAPVAHRVIESYGDGSVRTRGDANEFADMAITRREEIVGPVVRVLPFGKLLASWRGE